MAERKKRAMCSACGKKQALIKSYCKACAKAEGVEPTPAKAVVLRMVKHADIDFDHSPQIRLERLSEEYVAELSAFRKDGGEYHDRPVLFSDAALLIGDGMHRLAADEDAGLDETECEIRSGGPREALAYALSSNEHHGRKRTSAEKRRAVEIALTDPEWSTWNSYQLARLCGVSHTFVDNMRSPVVNVDNAHPTNPTNSGTFATSDAPAHPDPQSPPGGDSAVSEPDHVAPAPVLCDRCKRVGVARDCKECTKLRAGNNGARNGPRAIINGVPEGPQSPSPGEPLLDDVGVPVPELTRVAWNNIDKFGECRRLLRATADALADLAASPGGEQMAQNMQLTKHGDAERHESEHIQRLLGQLKLTVPYAAMCPHCTFDALDAPSPDCRACLGLGWVTKQSWGQAQAEHRDAVLAHKEGGAACD